MEGFKNRDIKPFIMSQLQPPQPLPQTVESVINFITESAYENSKLKASLTIENQLQEKISEEYLNVKKKLEEAEKEIGNLKNNNQLLEEQRKSLRARISHIANENSIEKRKCLQIISEQRAKITTLEERAKELEHIDTIHKKISRLLNIQKTKSQPRRIGSCPKPKPRPKSSTSTATTSTSICSSQ